MANIKRSRITETCVGYVTNNYHRFVWNGPSLGVEEVPPNAICDNCHKNYGDIHGNTDLVRG